MTEIKHIAILDKPTPAQRNAFKVAKEALGVTEPMKFIEAQPGCGRAVSFGSSPEFACDWLILASDDPADAKSVLAWYLELQDDWRVHTIAEWLSRVMGRGGVLEL